MPLKPTAEDFLRIWPKAPSAVINAFSSDEGLAQLARAGILDTRARFAFAMANVEHECGGFTIPGLTENISYSAERMAAVWPNRFASADDVRRKYGTSPGWQLRAFDDIYGSRMGNKPNSHDGSTYIGRAGPQITGRNGYDEVGKRVGVDLVNNPTLASSPALQPAILAGFWMWKGMNKYADTGQFVAGVKAWNGGTNGIADRQAKEAGNDPFVQRIMIVDAIKPAVKDLAGKPKPIDDVIADVNADDSKRLKAGAGAVVVGGGTEVAKTTTATEQPSGWTPPAYVTVPCITLGVVAIIYFAWRMGQRRAAVLANWF